MKRIILVTLAVSILATPATASAQSFDINNDLNGLFAFKKTSPEKPTNVPLKKETPPAKPVEPPVPVPLVYAVIENDNLSKIGTAHNVEWQRLWAKNTQLTNPDLIHIGDQITIPLPSETLQRDLPAVVALPAQTPGVAPLHSYDGSNTYDYGYCTWYVKNRRGASLPNMLGNANTWYARASGMGMAVGSEPRAGAVGTTTAGSLGHVVYVESVNPGAGTVNISEMNYAVFGVQSSRTTSANEFMYIY